MEYILLSVVSFYLGWKICEAIMASSFREILKDLQVPEDRIIKLAENKGVKVEQPEGHNIELWVEEISGCYYAYEQEQNNFVTQAKTPEALLEQIIEHYPAGTKITMDKDRGGRLIQEAAKKLKIA
jgi:predicted RNase H-like HicB family nuclease